MRPQFPFGPDAFQFAPASDRGNELPDLDHEPQRRAGYIEAAEFEQVIRPGFRYVLEEAGVMNGKRLWSVFRQRTGEERGEPR